MDDTTLIDLIPDYVLGSLSSDEQAQVDALLARSQEARDSLLAYEQTLAGLALLSPVRKAPAHLTDDFSKRLQTMAAVSVVKPPISQLPRRRTAWLLLSAAALLILIIGIVFAVRANTNARQQQLEQQTIAQIINNSAAHQTVLRFADANNQAHVVFYSVQAADTDGVLAIQGLSVLPTGKQYQLWTINSGNTVSAGVFDAGTQQVMRLIHLQAAVGTYKQMAITIEPIGGSIQPSGQPIATGTLS